MKALLVVAALGLGCSPSQRQQTIGITVVALKATNDALVGSGSGACNGCYLQRHEQALIAAGSNEADTQLKVATFELALAKIEYSIGVALQLAGTAYAANTDGALAAFEAAAAAALNDAKQLQGSGQ